jgi:hypothetical protein
MPQVVKVDVHQSSRLERRAPYAREVAAAELAPFGPVKTRLSGAALVKSSRCSSTSANRNGGMVTERIPASDLGGPVTRAPVVSSIAAAPGHAAGNWPQVSQVTGTWLADFPSQ